jgi:hypothetical protein
MRRFKSHYQENVSKSQLDLRGYTIGHMRCRNALWSYRFRFMCTLLLCWPLDATHAQGLLEFERAPIAYSETPSHTRVSQLQQQLDAKHTSLSYDIKRGYLPSLLSELELPVSSQLLVFSRTSAQRQISPQQPRAIYFNDDTYLGWVPSGDLIELLAMDPQQGAIFYTLPRRRQKQPHISRDGGQCLLCHASARTLRVPAPVARSVIVDRQGQSLFGAGSHTTDHRTAFKKRWGGWYVTGTHGTMRHRGNVAVRDYRTPETLNREAGANITNLSGHLRTSIFPSPHSDLVAIMVLDHQVRMHNLLTLANYETRLAIAYDQSLNKALDRPVDYQSASTQRRIMAAAEKVVRYMLFSDEPRLPSPIQGTSKFAEQFAHRGPRDRHGRSLRDFNLKTRLFKYPCSYLVYSASFKQLPAPVRQHISKRLRLILSGQDESKAFRHLSLDTRQTIQDILRETAPNLIGN